MTLSAALNTSLSGLTAASRTVSVISANIANAQTEGYGPRRVELASQTIGGVGAGVRVSGTHRSMDASLRDALRLADAATASATSRADFLGRIEASIGIPGSGHSLADRLDRFESGLIAAAARPESDSLLHGVLQDARDLATKFSDISTTIQNQRLEADAAIARDVAALNAGLAQVAELNAQILRGMNTGQAPLGLIDQRQQVIDSLSAIVPLVEVPREREQVALMTKGGAILLDANVAPLGFIATPVMEPGFSLADGPLSGLVLNGQAVATGADGPLSGGRLGALFTLRDETGPQAQAQLDALAADLVLRLQSPLADATLAPGDPGLFTDAGAALIPPAAPGLAARLQLHPAADPAAGGALWHLRSGLNAAVPGPVGDGTLLDALAQALERPASDTPGSAHLSASGRVGEFLTGIGTARNRAEVDLAFRNAQGDTLREEFLATGVDTDAELQHLLRVEKAYAANARVIRVVDEMLRRLMEI